MTSKISFIKLIVQDIRHRGWTAALSAIALFLMMPVYTMALPEHFLRQHEARFQRLRSSRQIFSGDC